MTSWQIFPTSELVGTVAVPGSKSHTIRAVAAALLVGAIAVAKRGWEKDTGKKAVLFFDLDAKKTRQSEGSVESTCWSGVGPPLPRV